MKKVFAIAFLAATFVACNNSSDKKKEGTDSTKMDTVTVTPATTTTPTTPATDSNAVKTDSAK